MIFKEFLFATAGTTKKYTTGVSVTAKPLKTPAIATLDDATVAPQGKNTHHAREIVILQAISIMGPESNALLSI